MHIIGFIFDDESFKDSKEIGKSSHASSKKAKDKKVIDMESLTRTIKSMSNELAELKQRTRETNVRRKPLKFNFLQRTNKNNNNSQ